MAGDERSRHCSLCKLNVYNLSDMTRPEIEELIVKNEGRLCVCFYRRPDGRVMVADCPKGFARVRKGFAVAILACASLVLASGYAQAKAISHEGEEGRPEITNYQPFKFLNEWVHPTKAPAPPTPIRYVVGALAMPRPPAKP
jgi:hypothetical protein